MTCREVVELLIDFVGNELPAERRRCVEEHLGCCATCHVYAQTYRATIKLTRRLPRTAQAPPHLLERLRAALNVMPMPKPPPPPGGCYA